MPSLSVVFWILPLLADHVLRETNHYIRILQCGLMKEERRLEGDHPIQYFDSPRVPLDYAHKPSMRVSLNPQFLNYDPIHDSGINVGYNQQEQTVGVGESKKYLWYADKEYGACIIQSFGDMRNHRYHGLFGVIIIEPAGAKWYKNFSLCKTVYDEAAVITAPGTESFRECVVVTQNGIRMLQMGC